MMPPSASPLPPPTPKYILRGHNSPIQSLKFYAQNSRLVSGDSDGWIVVWNTATKRAVGSWRAHGGAILCVMGFELEAFESDDGGGRAQKETRIFTHGRDHKLRVWRLNTSDEANLGTKLPVDFESSSSNRESPSETAGGHCGAEPWLLHSLDVNALNFCAFSARRLPEVRWLGQNDSSASSSACYRGQPHFLLAAPNALNTGGIDIFHLPSQRRVSTISPAADSHKGMVMAVHLLITEDENLCVVSGYEEGTAIVYLAREKISWEQLMNGTIIIKDWVVIYSNRSHTQPILSLSVSDDETGDKSWFITSSADSLVVKHPIPLPSRPTITTISNNPLRVFNTHHASQQSLTLRSDNRLFATAGWDGKGRVYATKSMKECAVLKWHRQGCFAIAFAEVEALKNNTDQKTTNEELVLSSPHTTLEAIKEQRAQKAQDTHWIALGSKDGKISLWDVY